MRLFIFSNNQFMLFMFKYSAAKLQNTGSLISTSLNSKTCDLCLFLQKLRTNLHELALRGPEFCSCSIPWSFRLLSIFSMLSDNWNWHQLHNTMSIKITGQNSSQEAFYLHFASTSTLNSLARCLCHHNNNYYFKLGYLKDGNDAVHSADSDMQCFIY